MIFFYGSQYAPGATVLQFMAFGIGLLTLFYVMSFAFQGAGLVRVPLRIAFFGMLMNAVLNFMLIKNLGMIGSGIATSITAIFVTILLFFALKKEFDVSLKLSTLSKMFFASILIYGLSFILPGQHLLFILSGGILFLFYLGILYLLKELGPDDIAMIKGMIPGLRKKQTNDIQILSE
jgi:O-antigen/teichoic acid export membrane protein